MDYAQQQRDPARHAIGIGFVVLVHALVIWALMSGLGKHMIEVIKKPLSATIIEEVKLPPPPPPPPPPKKLVEPPKQEPLVQPYVPPPDIPVAAPTTAPVISSVTATPPPEPVQIARPAVVAPPAPPPPKPAVRKGIVPIEREIPEYPRSAIRAGIDRALVVARLNIDEKGNVSSVTIMSPPSRHFDAVVIEALKRWKFQADGEKYVGEIEINFKMSE